MGIIADVWRSREMLTKTLTGTFEMSVQRSLDPAGHSTPVVGAFSLAWLAKPSLQLDVGANKGVS